MAENKTRITITLGRRVLEKLDDYCDETGLTRSAAISTMIAAQLASRREIMDKLESAFTPEVMKALIEGDGE